MRPEAILQIGRRRPLDEDAAGKAVRIHGLDVGIPDQIDVFRRQPGEVGLPGPRVGSEILRRRKLGRVHEDRYHDFAGASLRQPNQRHMAVMERSHGRHQRDRGFSRTKAVERAAQRGDCAGDHGA